MANKVSRWEKGLCTSNDQAWLIGLVSRCTRVVQLAYLVAREWCPETPVDKALQTTAAHGEV